MKIKIINPSEKDITLATNNWPELANPICHSHSNIHEEMLHSTQQDPVGVNSSTGFFTLHESYWENCWCNLMLFPGTSPYFNWGQLTPRNSSSLFKNVNHVWCGDGAAFSSRVLSWKGASESSISDALWNLNRNVVIRKFSSFLCSVLNSQKGEFSLFTFSKQSCNQSFYCNE